MYTITNINKNICIKLSNFVPYAFINFKSHIMNTNLELDNGKKRMIFMLSFGLACGLFLVLLTKLNHKVHQAIEELVSYSAQHYFVSGFVLLLICVLALRAIVVPNRSRYIGKTVFINRRTRTQKRLYRLFLQRIRLLKELKKRKEPTIKSQTVNTIHADTFEVLKDESQIRQREKDLKLAMAMCQTKDHEVKLTFNYMGFKRTKNTKLWHYDEKYVMLKGGIVLPVNSIYKIEF